ncbi:MAG: hypothetical protein MHMPM18_001576 [Marteilia pararefringens]
MFAHRTLLRHRGSLHLLTTTPTLNHCSTRRFGDCSIEKYDLAVIGSGPGGYVAAIRAAQLGQKVLSIEKHRTLGGTCLNVGCIPSKTLLNTSHIFSEIQSEKLKQLGIKLENDAVIDMARMMDNKANVVKKLTQGIEFLYKKNKVERKRGLAKILDRNSIEISCSPSAEDTNSGQSLKVEAKNIIIATGSESIGMPGLDIDEIKIVSSTGGLEFKEIPKDLVIVGGGIIGLEMGSIWSRLGSKVTIVEYTDKIGGPAMDNEVAQEFKKCLTSQGICFLTKHKFDATKLQHVSDERMQIILDRVDDTKNESRNLECDKLLICVGRQPATKSLFCEEFSDSQEVIDKRGFVKVDADMETQIPGIFAIGDCTDRGPALAHRAEDEAIRLVERLYNNDRKEVHYGCIPSVVYTHPEVAWVGVTEQDLIKQGSTDFSVGKIKMSSNSRAICTASSKNIPGFIKIISRKSDGTILGAHLMCEAAGEMIYGLSAIIQYGGSCEDLHSVSFPHPTLSEAIREALFIADAKIGQPINS